MTSIIQILNAGGSIVIFTVSFLATDFAIGRLVKRRYHGLIRNALLVLFGPATIFFHLSGGAVGPHGVPDQNLLLDARGAAIALATLFGGFPVGFLAMLAEIVTRVWIGGQAMVAGVLGIAGDFLLCAAAIRLIGGERGPGLVTWRELWLAGCVVGIGEASSLLLVGSWQNGLILLRHEGAPLFMVQLLGTLIFGSVLKIQADMHAARDEVELERQHRSKVRLEEEAFRAGAITATTDSLMKLDLAGNIVEVADSYVRWSGFSREELIGMPVRKRNADLSDRQIEEALKDVVRSGKLVLETVHRRKDGSAVPVEVVAVHSQADGGCIYVFLRDITDRKEAERQLAEKSIALKSALEQAVRALSAAMVHRDLTTAGHEDRVADLAIALGRELHLDDERLEGLGLAAMVHDIGQIQVPTEILLRPQRLSPEERALMQMHPQAGAHILADIAFPWPIAEIVHQHHENLDGSGYPRGLKGGEILLEARIIRVADSVEAMLSHRPFRRARSVDYVLSELKAGSGRQFDPEIVDACVKLLNMDHYELKALPKAAE